MRKILGMGGGGGAVLHTTTASRRSPMMLSRYRKRSVARGPGRRLAGFVGIAAWCIAAGAGPTPIAAAQAQADATRCFANYKMLNKRLALQTIADCSLLLARPGTSISERIEAHILRGSNYQYLKRYPEAIVEYTAVFKAEPRKAIHYSWRAYFYEQIGKRQEAIRDYRKSLQLDPSFRSSKEGLKRLGG